MTKGKLTDEILKQTGVILVCWQHERIYEIASRLVQAAPPENKILFTNFRFDIIWLFQAPAAAGQRWSFTQIPQRLFAGDADTVVVETT